MIFQKKRISSLNEAVTTSIKDIEKLATVGTVDQSFVEAAKEIEQRDKATKELFKDFDKNAEEFNKDIEKREKEPVKDVGLKKMKLEESLFEDYIPEEETLTEAPAAEPIEKKKRIRTPNVKHYKGDYSSVDLWLAVYDELSSELDNEGNGQEVNKQIKAKKGERYQHVYPVEGSNDLVVYAMTPDRFDFAKRVCDYYGVTHDEPREDKNSMTNEYYKYSMRIHIPETQIYQWDEEE